MQMFVGADNDRLTADWGTNSDRGRHHIADGQSAYEPGEEVILFLEPKGSEYVEIGIGIAKYSVEHDGKTKIVTHNPSVAEARLAR